MYLIIKNHKYLYNVQSVSQIFFQNETFENADEVSLYGTTLKSEVTDDEIISTLYIDGVEKLSYRTEKNTDISHFVKVSVFLLLRNYFNYNPAWGMLTGIRPTKLVLSLLKKGYDYEEIEDILRNKYFVSDEKIEFCLNVSKNEIEVTKHIDVNKACLYINIPFCPSICSYCSFTSFNMKKYRDNKVMDTYVDYLIKEILHILNNSAKEIENVYIGGGTPTSLDDYNFERLLKTIFDNIDTFNLKEYTVEAGRVDTITKENLLIMKKYNVGRISINAQTMNDETLKKNGRTCTKNQFLDTFKLARDIGFDNINIDMIVGLLGENEEDVKNTLNEILKLNPENITIHTLAIKKGSIYKQKINDFSFLNDEKIKNILSYCYRTLYKNSYLPYYMYRQKNMLGNFENTGFCKNGFSSIYNVSIILETQDIIGVGAGASSKHITEENKVKRIYNFKGVEEYIKNFDVVLERKNAFVM